MSTRTRSRRIHWLTYWVFLAIFSVALDCTLGTFWIGQSSRSFRVAHPFYHHALLPNQRTTTTWGGRRSFCEREKVGFVNLFPAFIDAALGGPDAVYDRYFIRDDVHWNEAGNARVAGQMEAVVLGPGRS